jgi:hypothetical protein
MRRFAALALALDLGDRTGEHHRTVGAPFSIRPASWV